LSRIRASFRHLKRQFSDIKMESLYKTLIDLDILITQSDQIPHKRRLCFLLEPTGVSIVMKKTMGLVSTLMLSAVMFTGCQNMSASDQRIGAAALGGAVGGGVGNHVGGSLGAGVGAAAGAGVGANAKGGSSNSTTSSAIGAGIGAVIGKSIFGGDSGAAIGGAIGGGAGAAIQEKKK
jgi:hypothetical protein